MPASTVEVTVGQVHHPPPLVPQMPQLKIATVPRLACHSRSMVQTRRQLSYNRNTGMVTMPHLVRQVLSKVPRLRLTKLSPPPPPSLLLPPLALILEGSTGLLALMVTLTVVTNLAFILACYSLVMLGDVRMIQWLPYQSAKRKTKRKQKRKKIQR